MAKKIKPQNLAKSIEGIVSDFQGSVLVAVDKVIDEVAEESAERLKKAGDFGGTGAYKRDWDWKVVKSKAYSHSAVAYNEDHYRLSHLLEFGHAKRNGGRTRPFEHIAPINEWAQKEVVERIKKAVSEV